MKIKGRMVAGAMMGLALLAALAGLHPDSAAALVIRNDVHDVQAARPGPASCGATSKAENAAAARATSQRRAAAGLAPVRANARLAQVAADHACDMARRGLMTHAGSTTTGPHQRLKASGYRPTLTAENIAAGPMGLGQVLAAWNGSPGHLRNVMHPQVADYGIGRAVGSDGKTVFWAAVYAAPRR